MLEVHSGLKECLEFRFLLWSLLFLTAASESSRATMTLVDEPPVGLWGAKLASVPWLGHRENLCIPHAWVSDRAVVNL